MAKSKDEPKKVRKPASERRKNPIGVDPRKERRRAGAEARRAALTRAALSVEPVGSIDNL